MSHPNVYADVLRFNQAIGAHAMGELGQGLHVPSEESRLLGGRLVLEETLEMLSALGLRVTFTMSGGAYHALADLLGDQAITLGLEAHRPMGMADVVDVCDAVADLGYVTHGVGLRVGMGERQWTAVWHEVTRANMDKTTGPRRADGKQLKPEGWRPPDLLGALGLHPDEVEPA